MYKDLENKNINEKIQLIANDNQIPLIKRSELFCDIKEKRCPAITEKGYKIYWDYGHLTEKGAEFLLKNLKTINCF